MEGSRRMTDFDVKEKRFEQDIEEYLCSIGGYTKGSPAVFDRTLALDKATLLSFIQSTQPKSWEKFVRIYGGDSERQLIDRFCRVVKQAPLCGDRGRGALLPDGRRGKEAQARAGGHGEDT